GTLDPVGPVHGEFRVLSRSTHFGDAAGRDRGRIPHSHLLGRVYVGGRRLLPLFRLPEPVHVLHAHPGAGGQLPADVHWVGRRRPGVISADRILVHQGLCGVGGQEGIHRQSHWRLRIPDRTILDDQAFRIPEFRRRLLGGGEVP